MSWTHNLSDTPPPNHYAPQLWPIDYGDELVTLMFKGWPGWVDLVAGCISRWILASRWLSILVLTGPDIAQLWYTKTLVWTISPPKVTSLNAMSTVYQGWNVTLRWLAHYDWCAYKSAKKLHPVISHAHNSFMCSCVCETATARTSTLLSVLLLYFCSILQANKHFRSKQWRLFRLIKAWQHCHWK